MNASGLTNEMIRNNAIYSEMPSYLQKGETKESILKKFNGDLVKAIQFLRKREFNKVECASKSEYPEEHILNPIHDPVYTKEEKITPVKKKKKSFSENSQNKLF